MRLRKLKLLLAFPFFANCGGAPATTDEAISALTGCAPISAPGDPPVVCQGCVELCASWSADLVTFSLATGDVAPVFVCSVSAKLVSGSETVWAGGVPTGLKTLEASEMQALGTIALSTPPNTTLVVEEAQAMLAAEMESCF